jgi:hypothetical protein
MIILAEVSMSSISQALQLPPVSGTYSTGPTTLATRQAIVRLDVDGSFPQMIASGTMLTSILAAGISHWVAEPLEYTGDSAWEGPITEYWGNPIPYTRVRIHVPHAQFYVSTGQQMTVTFLGGAGAADRTQKLDWVSAYFHTIDLEIDRVVGSDTSFGLYPLTPFNPCFLADRPPDLPCERLTVEKVYSRAGVEFTRSKGDNVLPLSASGIDKEWSDSELNDAMHVYWSTYSSRARWAVWLLVAGKHAPTNFSTGTGPFGTMFDDSDKNQRQGLAIFTQEIEASLPGNSPERNVEAHRKCFFAALHELGHCFNLFHAFDKWGGKSWKWDIEDLTDYPTIMNYPERYELRNGNFYNAFRYRFADSELKFIRHAPEEFVQMGAAAFGKDHGYVASAFADRQRDGGHWTLSAAVQRPRGVFEFLEPAILTLTLTNTGRHAAMVDAAALEDADAVAVTIVSGSGAARRLRPFVQRCYFPHPRVLEPGASLKSSYFVSAGTEGWYLAEPGGYTLYAEACTPEGTATAEPLRVRVAHPRSWDEETLAADYFTKDVGRALALGGTHAMTSAIAALRETIERAPNSAAARHAAIALARPLMSNRRVLRVSAAKEFAEGAEPERRFDEVWANREEARALFERALLDKREATREVFGDLYDELLEEFHRWLQENGERGAAKAGVARRAQKAPSRAGK